MPVRLEKLVFLLALVVAIAGDRHAWAQDSSKSKDDALDSLINELVQPKNAAPKSTARPGVDASKSGSSQDKSKATPGSSSSALKNAKASGRETAKSSAPQTGKPKASKSAGNDKVAPKDQALDELLGKLGDSKDEPSADDRPRNRAAGEGPTEPSKADKPSPAKLGGKDKDLDERLEELAGRKKRRRSTDEERTGPIGEMIKEMRDVEQRLGKPDSGDETQKKQGQIIKRINVLIEEARQSGSSMGRLTMRRMRQSGQQPGDQTGALARGAPPTKPAKPTGQRSTAGSKEVWGHLPAELRTVMDNSFKEIELDSKRELITRYFLSVGKGKLVREE